MLIHLYFTISGAKMMEISQHFINFLCKLWKTEFRGGATGGGGERTGGTVPHSSQSPFL